MSIDFLTSNASSYYTAPDSALSTFGNENFTLIAGLRADFTNAFRLFLFNG